MLAGEERQVFESKIDVQLVAELMELGLLFHELLVAFSYAAAASS